MVTDWYLAGADKADRIAGSRECLLESNLCRAAPVCLTGRTTVIDIVALISGPPAASRPRTPWYLTNPLWLVGISSNIPSASPIETHVSYM